MANWFVLKKSSVPWLVIAAFFGLAVTIGLFRLGVLGFGQPAAGAAAKTVLGAQLAQTLAAVRSVAVFVPAPDRSPGAKDDEVAGLAIARVGRVLGATEAAELVRLVLDDRCQLPAAAITFRPQFAFRLSVEPTSLQAVEVVVDLDSDQILIGARGADGRRLLKPRRAFDPTLRPDFRRLAEQGLE